MIAEKIEVSDAVPASGGDADVWTGAYMGARVAVKVRKVGERDDVIQIRKVNIDGVSSTTECDSDSHSTAILRRSCPLE